MVRRSKYLLVHYLSYVSILCLLSFMVRAEQEIPVSGSIPRQEKGSFSLKEGDLVTFEKVEILKPYLPQEFWANRHFFFWNGMKIKIGPAFRDYSPPLKFKTATERFSGEVRIGPGSSLENYTAGQPFPMEEIDCLGDPYAGSKIIWNFDRQWSGDGAKSHFLYTYFDRGEQLGLYYQGEAKVIEMTNRIEPEYLDNNGGDIFKDDIRKLVFGIEVDDPYESRGLASISYRYKSSQSPPEAGKFDDTWIYQPDARRVRRFSSKQRTDAISGTDFTFDDLRSFAGIVPHYEWRCLGELILVAPMNSEVRAYPYSEDHDFGPYGLSFANDLWELRKSIVVRSIPLDDDHPYKHKDIYIDAQTMSPLYSFAYDRKGDLWKIIWHNHRWSEDDPDWYLGWSAIPEPRDLRIVSDIIVNVQTGTGNRIEFWDSHGTPLRSKAKVRRYIDISRLSQGR